MRCYICEGQLNLFDISIYETETPEERIENLRHGDVYRYRTKTIKAGNMLECEIFPIWKTQPEVCRAKKANPTRETQEKLNHKNNQKKVMRLTNNNFTDADIWGTFGYDDDTLPQTPEQARKDVINFIRRIKNKRAKQGLPALRYIYVTEWRQNESEKGGKISAHNHIILSGDMDRDEIEKLWKRGAYPQTRRLRVKEDCGLNGLACYISKGSRNEKMWGHSTNLKMPVATVADKKVTPHKAGKIAYNQQSAAAHFEKLYKGYTFNGIEVKRSEFVAGVYIYVQMYRKDPPNQRKRRRTPF